MDNEVVQEGSTKSFEISTYTWSLHNFLKLCDNYEFGNSLKSPLFPETDSKRKWRLIVYPNCLQNINTVGVALWLETDTPVFVKFTILILNLMNEILCQKSGKHYFNKKMDAKGLVMIILSELKSKLLIVDIVKIQIILSEKISTWHPFSEINTRQEYKSITKLKNELKMMFENREFCDFVIKLSDSSEIPVHRNILAARCPVFSAMFKNDTLENKMRYVKITDIDKETLMMLLNFIYTGNINSDLSTTKAKKLLTAADKYEILDLKQLCAEYLAHNLKISNVIDILLLAELYSISELKNRAFRFILENMEDFTDTDIFKKIEKRFPNLLTELLKMKTSKDLNQKSEPPVHLKNSCAKISTPKSKMKILGYLVAFVFFMNLNSEITLAVVGSVSPVIILVIAIRRFAYFIYRHIW